MTDPPYTGPKVEARDAGNRFVQVPREIEDPFRYGSRWVRVKTARGTELREIPLTREDLFDPQEGDHLPHSTEHGDLVSKAKEQIRQAFKSRGRTDVLVCDDVKMFWKDPALPRIAPDVAVIPGIADPETRRPSFNEEKEGTGPVFVLEVISEATGSFDYKDKPKVYRRAGVEECFHLDPLTTPWKLLGRRLHPNTGQYRKIRPGNDGRIRSRTLGLDFVIAPGGKGLLLVDVATGEALRDLSEAEEARRAAERKAREEAAAREAAERRILDVLAATLVSLLAARDLPLTQKARRRIFDCQDSDRLQRWIGRVSRIDSVDELWD